MRQKQCLWGDRAGSQRDTVTPNGPVGQVRARSINTIVDDGIVSMTFGLTQTLHVAPGEHVLTAEFVAVDHAPFNPRIRRSVRFQGPALTRPRDLQRRPNRAAARSAM